MTFNRDTHLLIHLL